MPTFTLHHFSKAETLRAAQAEYLLELLGQYGDYFRSRGIDLGSSNDALDYEAVAHVLMAPDETTPVALVNDLYYIDELATPEAMDGLLEAAKSAGVELALTDEPTPADVAVQLRLRAPQLLEKKHAEYFVLQGRRTFEYFQSRDGVSTAFHPPGARAL